jgi:hypothetical protein
MRKCTGPGVWAQKRARRPLVTQRAPVGDSASLPGMLQWISGFVDAYEMKVYGSYACLWVGTQLCDLLQVKATPRPSARPGPDPSNATPSL